MGLTSFKRCSASLYLLTRKSVARIKARIRRVKWMIAARRQERARKNWQNAVKTWTILEEDLQIPCDPLLAGTLYVYIS